MEVEEDIIVKETPTFSQMCKEGKCEAFFEGVPTQVTDGRGRSRRRRSRTSNHIG